MKLYETESKMSAASLGNRGKSAAPSLGDRRKYTVPSYRDELGLRQPERVDARYRGGAFGCPGDYFAGARAEDCRPPEEAKCRACWDGEYRDEEWIEYEE